MPIVGLGLNWFVETRWLGARSSIVARTRLIDEWLCQTVESEVKQVVLLGAGFDSRAWRLPALAHASLKWTIRRHRRKNGGDWPV